MYGSWCTLLLIYWHLGVCDVLYKKNPNPQDDFIDINDSDADDEDENLQKPTHLLIQILMLIFLLRRKLFCLINQMLQELGVE